jgi:hypothetical protein
MNGINVKYSLELSKHASKNPFALCTATPLLCSQHQSYR